MATSINNMAKLIASLDKAKNCNATNKSYVDPRFYKPTLSQDGTSQAIIRFILPKNPDGDPIVGVYNHKFQGQGGGFYYENCPTTVGAACPVCAENRIAYNTKDEYEISKAKQRVRKQKFIVNILIVKDGNTPENNGKVFLFELDKKSFEKVIARVQPAEGAIDEPIDVFSVIDGANFKLIGFKKTIPLNGKDITFTSFDNSSFADPSPLSKDLVASIEGLAFDLDEFVDPSKFKTFEALADRFAKVNGGNTSSVKVELAPAGSVMEEDPIATAFDEEPPKKPTKKTKVSEVAAEASDEDDDDSAFLAKLRDQQVI